MCSGVDGALGGKVEMQMQERVSWLIDDLLMPPSSYSMVAMPLERET